MANGWRDEIRRHQAEKRIEFNLGESTVVTAAHAPQQRFLRK